MPQPAPTPLPLHEVAPVMEIFPWPWWQIALVALLVFAFLGLVVWWVFLRPRPRHTLSPRQRALAALVLLQSRQELEPREFAARVSRIVREYVEEVYRVKAVAATSLEFLEALRSHPLFVAEERALLESFLEVADLMKFARFEGSPQERARLIAAAEALVRKASPNEQSHLQHKA